MMFDIDFFVGFFSNEKEIQAILIIHKRIFSRISTNLKTRQDSIENHQITFDFDFMNTYVFVLFSIHETKTSELYSKNLVCYFPHSTTQRNITSKKGILCMWVFRKPVMLHFIHFIY